MYHPLLRGCLALVLTLSVAIFFGCGDDSGLDTARDLERQILVANPSATFADPGYLRVAEALEAVPPSSDDYDEAQALLQKIQDARRIALNNAHGLDYLPERLKQLDPKALSPQTEGVAPAKPKVEVVPGGGVAQGQEEARGKEVANHTPEVILYSTSWCGYCRKARNYFTRNQIPFLEKDIEKDPLAAKEMRKKVGGRSGVPVIDIDGTIVRGYNLGAIKKALKKG